MIRMRYATLVFSITMLLLVAACMDDSSAQEYTGYMPPCIPPEGSTSNPCEPRESGGPTSGEASVTLGDPEPRGMDFYLKSTKVHVAHLVVRATYLPGTARCVPTGDFLRRHPYHDDNLASWELAFANTKAVYCYIDVRVNEYIVGSGPTTLTVLYFHRLYRAYDAPREDAISLREERWVSGFASLGYEAMLFLMPAFDMQGESWEVKSTWNLEQQGSTVVAVHPLRDYWLHYKTDGYNTYRSSIEMQLPAFRQAVKAAHQARLSEHGGRTGAEAKYPMLVSDANRLSGFFREIGAYDHPNGPPVQPPPPCGLVVADQIDNRDFMRDCTALLAGKDRLRGTGALNWDTGTAMASWDGVTTADTPARVTKVVLPSKSLTGTIPPELGELSNLTHLDLSNNSLTGDIPMALGRLDNLVEIRLSGNSLTGCIPYGLKDVTTNDLAALSLLYCPPAPDGFRGGESSETSLPLSWTAVANTTKYRVEYRVEHPITGIGPWTLDDESITAAAHTVDGLRCNTGHQFRVSAYGDGTTYAAAWGESSETQRVTGSCTPPVFSQESYSFTVTADAAIGTTVGTVSATDYDIRSWDVDYPYQIKLFALDENTGAFTVTADLSNEAGLTVPMTVAARDQDGGWKVVDVSIEVTKS